MKDKNHFYGARISALAVSVALTLAAAIGLTTASELSRAARRRAGATRRHPQPTRARLRCRRARQTTIRN